MLGIGGLNKKCIFCGKTLIGKQRKFCSYEHKLEYYKKMRAIKKKGRRTCIVCGKPLTTRQTMYCSQKHQMKHRSNQGYYRKRYRKLVLKKSKVCHVCGKVLPPQKQKYCSYTCARIRKNLWDSTPFEVDKFYPVNPLLNCDECGGRVILMSDNEYVCEKCGLVY